LATYHRRLSEDGFRLPPVHDDDNAVHPEDVDSLWDPTLRLRSILSDDGVFPADTTLRLRKSEAKVLRDRYDALTLNDHRTLITHMVTVALNQGVTALNEFALPWDIPALPENTAKVVEHARRLSLFARGTTLQYYRMLIEKKGVEDAGADAAFSAWWEAAHEDLRTWDLDAFFRLIAEWGADRRPVQDRAFLRNWIACCVKARSGDEALRDADARRVIAEREHHVRRGKERLRVKFQLDSWQPLNNYHPGNFYQLEYRHSVGRQFAEDIVDGLARGTS
jgi:hypothetical protein